MFLESLQHCRFNQPVNSVENMFPVFIRQSRNIVEPSKHGSIFKPSVVLSVLFFDKFKNSGKLYLVCN